MNCFRILLCCTARGGGHRHDYYLGSGLHPHVLLAAPRFVRLNGTPVACHAGDLRPAGEPSQLLGDTETRFYARDALAALAQSGAVHVPEAVDADEEPIALADLLLHTPCSLAHIAHANVQPESSIVQSLQFDGLAVARALLLSVRMRRLPLRDCIHRAWRRLWRLLDQSPVPAGETIEHIRTLLLLRTDN